MHISDPRPSSATAFRNSYYFRIPRQGDSPPYVLMFSLCSVASSLDLISIIRKSTAPSQQGLALKPSRIHQENRLFPLGHAYVTEPKLGSVGLQRFSCSNIGLGRLYRFSRFDHQCITHHHRPLVCHHESKPHRRPVPYITDRSQAI